MLLMSKLSTVEILIVIASCWRLTNLICNEDGPFSLFKRFRAVAAHMHDNVPLCSAFNLRELTTCEWCMSVWVGAGITAALFFVPNVVLVLAPLALSAATIWVKYALQLIRQFSEP